ncbi:MAG: lysophospholipid acyltransferase family protein [Thermoguttaceae bacterium]
MTTHRFRLALDWCVYIFVRLLVCVAQSLPPEMALALARAMAFVMTNVIPVRRRLVKANLQRAFPDLSPSERRQLIYAMWEHLLLMGIETFLARRQIGSHNWWQSVTLENVTPILAQLNRSRPTIIVTGHFGNFEIGGLFLGAMGYPTFSVARTLDNPFLDRFVRDCRETTGQFLISKNEGYDDILRVLEHNGTVAFLADQSAGRRGLMVPFFGHPASTFKAIAILSLQYDAPIIVCTSTRESGTWMRFRMHATELLDPRSLPKGVTNPREITEWYTRKLEEQIRRHPDQYWWLHKRWKT